MQKAKNAIVQHGTKIPRKLRRNISKKKPRAFPKRRGIYFDKEVVH